MKENKRCSILFHWLVPGGKWLTERKSPVSSASFCNSSFQSRNREPLLPPPSAVISKSRVLGYSLRPSARHQPRMDATAKAPVSWWVPTFTNPVLRSTSPCAFANPAQRGLRIAARLRTDQTVQCVRPTGIVGDDFLSP